MFMIISTTPEILDEILDMLSMNMTKGTHTHTRWYMIRTGIYNFVNMSRKVCRVFCCDVITSAMASQIAGVSIVCSTVCSGADKKKTLKLCVTGLCEGNSPVTGELPAQRTIDAENVSIWRRHHVYPCLLGLLYRHCDYLTTDPMSAKTPWSI